MTNSFHPALRGRYFRIHPQTWQEWISMRVELYTCASGQWVNFLNNQTNLFQILQFIIGRHQKGVGDWFWKVTLTTIMAVKLSARDIPGANFSRVAVCTVRHEPIKAMCMFRLDSPWSNSRYICGAISGPVSQPFWWRRQVSIVYSNNSQWSISLLCYWRLRCSFDSLSAWVQSIYVISKGVYCYSFPLPWSEAMFWQRAESQFLSHSVSCARVPWTLRHHAE